MSLQETEKYAFRPYRKGDAKDLIDFFNKTHEPLAGFVPRTLKYWRWCILSRPNMDEEGIVVAFYEDQIVGYAAVERSGKILEFCYNRNCGGELIVSGLLSWCTEYASHHGASSVKLNAPVQDAVVRQICEDEGFTEEPFPSLFLRILDVPDLFRKLLDLKKPIVEGSDETILVDLAKFPSWCPQHVAILVHDGQVAVSTEKQAKPTVRIEADISTIASCIFGSKCTLYRAILERRLRIRPLRKIPRALKLLSFFQLKKPPWFVPAADYG